MIRIGGGRSGTVLGLGLLALTLAGCGGEGTPSDPDRPAGESVDAAPIPATANLLFPNSAGLLGSEERAIESAPDAETRIEQLVTALLEGPTTRGLSRPFPEGTELGSVFLAISGIAYVDLVSEEGAGPPQTGSRGEMLSVYSLVNTVLLDQPQVDGVVLLWNGQQPPTFAGHLDTSRPLAVDRRLIAR